MVSVTLRRSPTNRYGHHLHATAHVLAANHAPSLSRAVPGISRHKPPTKPTWRRSSHDTSEIALYRETPNSGKYFLGEQGLEFSVRFSVRRPHHADREADTFATINTAIDRLSRGGGRSILEAVTASDDNYSEGGYIFRLTTIWHNNREKEVRHFQISESEWRHLLNQDASKPWTHLLQDLFTGASDRAYLHVQRQLQGSAYSPIDALKWNAYEILDANALLALNMRTVREQGTLLCLEPIRDFYGDENRVLTVRLPCEHETTVSIGHLRSLSRAACIDATCPACSRVILPNRDIVHANHSVERRRRQRKALDETLWKHIEARKIGHERRIDMSGAVLCQALTHALKSMQVPESASPRSVCPAWSEEATAILQHVRLEYGAGTHTFSMAMGDLYAYLTRTVDAVVFDVSYLHHADLSDQIFPGWAIFVRRWIDRTMALMTKPGYAGEDVWQVSGEVPDDDICFDDEEEVLGGDTDIGALLGGVSLL
jgi:hypothetical protein